MVLRRHIERDETRRETGQQEPPWYGTVCPVVWEDGGGDPASYPIIYGTTGNVAASLSFARRFGNGMSGVNQPFKGKFLSDPPV